MPIDDIRARLARVEDRQIKMVETLVAINDHLATQNGDVAAIKAEVGGAPEVNLRRERATLRERVHDLENDKNAALTAKAALDAAHRVRAGVWSRRQKIGIFAFAAAGALGSLLRLFGIGG